jgi:zinc transporter ZupT
MLTSAKFGLHGGNKKFDTQNEERINKRINYAQFSLRILTYNNMKTFIVKIAIHSLTEGVAFFCAFVHNKLIM